MVTSKDLVNGSDRLWIQIGRLVDKCRNANPQSQNQAAASLINLLGSPNCIIEFTVFACPQKMYRGLVIIQQFSWILVKMVV